MHKLSQKTDKLKNIFNIENKLGLLLSTKPKGNKWTDELPTL